MSSPPVLRAAIAGASGYIGMQCAELLARHPNVEVTQLAGRSSAGRPYRDVVPGSVLDLTIAEAIDPTSVDVIFACLPHTMAAVAAPAWLAGGAVLIDLSADFRLREPATYASWYGTTHPAPDLLEESVYALPELPWVRLDDANLLAMPGCYATAALLATAPARIAEMITADVIIDAKSGVSGAGRSPSLITHFSEANESVRAYSVTGHRHVAEIDQALRTASATPTNVTFVPHLVPMTRGILVTAYLRPREGVAAEDLEGAYRDFCADQPFLRYDAAPPATKSVAGTNMAAINVAWQDGTVIVTCAIDNLLKGAAGQAVQAFNIRMGFAPTTGLEQTRQWP